MSNPYLNTKKLRFSDLEFADQPAKVVAFVQCFGSHNWQKLLRQWAPYRIPQELPFTEKQIDKMSHEEYEQNRDKIWESQALPPKEKPVFGEISAPADVRSLGLKGQEIFIKHFGLDRYFQACGVSPDLSPENYHQAVGREYKPYNPSKLFRDEGKDEKQT